MKPKMTLDEQIAKLRDFGESRVMRNMTIVAMAMAMVAAYLFFSQNNQNLKVVMMFIGMLGVMVVLATVSMRKPLRRAAAATRHGRRVRTVIELQIDPDSENGRFFGQCTDRTLGHRWRIDFSSPMGWVPDEGSTVCELVSLPGDEEPALVITERGLLIPIWAKKLQHDGADIAAHHSGKYRP